MHELTPGAAEQFVARLEQNFEDAGDWGVQPTLMLIDVFDGDDPARPGALGLTPVYPAHWIRDGELPADALARIDPAWLRSLLGPSLSLVAVGLAYEAVVLSGKDARLLYCGLPDGTLVRAGRVRGDEHATVKAYAPDHPHDTTPAAVRRLAMAVLGRKGGTA